MNVLTAIVAEKAFTHLIQKPLALIFPSKEVNEQLMHWKVHPRIPGVDMAASAPPSRLCRFIAAAQRYKGTTRLKGNGTTVM